ncbi:MAG: ECF transporter S component [Candidatus Limnocylindria bacterium]
MRPAFTLGRLVAMLGALVALVAFFLPWANYEAASFSAAQLAAALGPQSAATQAGGIKGFDVALYLVPLLAVLSGAFVLASTLRAADGPLEARLRMWAAAAAVGGAGLALLFLGSAALGGTPGIDFAPGVVRTDTQVRAAVAQALGAGEFVGLGIGVYLTIGGFIALALGALLQRSQDAPARSAWRTQDLVLLAVIAVVFGAVYWAWLQPYLWIAPIAAQPGQELVFGMWFVAGLLGAYIVRRPGAAFLANTLAALAEVLLGAPAGPILLVTGMMQAIGAEMVFAATGYRRWDRATMATAGAVTALVALPWNWFRLGYFTLDPALLVVLVVIRLASGVLAGIGAKVLADLVAATGSLNYFPVGRERAREI